MVIVPFLTIACDLHAQHKRHIPQVTHLEVVLQLLLYCFDDTDVTPYD